MCISRPTVAGEMSLFCDADGGGGEEQLHFSLTEHVYLLYTSYIEMPHPLFKFTARYHEALNTRAPERWVGIYTPAEEGNLGSLLLLVFRCTFHCCWKHVVKGWSCFDF